MSTESWKFQFLPLEGKLSGRSFEQQTEDAINNLGSRVTEVEGTVDKEVSELTDLVEQAYALAFTANSLAETSASSASNTDSRVTVLENTVASLGAIPTSDVESLFEGGADQTVTASLSEI